MSDRQDGKFEEAKQELDDRFDRMQEDLDSSSWSGDFFKRMADEYGYPEDPSTKFELEQKLDDLIAKFEAREAMWQQGVKVQTGGSEARCAGELKQANQSVQEIKKGLIPHQQQMEAVQKCTSRMNRSKELMRKAEQNLSVVASTAMQGFPQASLPTSLKYGKTIEVAMSKLQEGNVKAAKAALKLSALDRFGILPSSKARKAEFEKMKAFIEGNKDGLSAVKKARKKVVSAENKMAKAVHKMAKSSAVKELVSNPDALKKAAGDPALAMLCGAASGQGKEWIKRQLESNKFNVDLGNVSRVIDELSAPGKKALDEAWSMQHLAEERLTKTGRLSKGAKILHKYETSIPCNIFQRKPALDVMKDAKANIARMSQDDLAEIVELAEGRMKKWADEGDLVDAVHRVAISDDADKLHGVGKKSVTSLSNTTSLQDRMEFLMNRWEKREPIVSKTIKKVCDFCLSPIFGKTDGRAVDANLAKNVRRMATSAFAAAGAMQSSDNSGAGFKYNRPSTKALIVPSWGN